jgi:subtilisin family serine protease
MVRRQVVVVALLCALVLAPVTHLPTTTDGGDAVDVDDADLRDELFAQRQGPPTVDQQANVVLRLSAAAELPETAGLDVQRRYTREGDRLVEGSMSYAEVDSLTGDPRIASIRVAGTAVNGSDDVAPAVPVVGADRLHAAGVTGENVTVGVIDSDFRIGHPAIASADTTYRSFDGTGDWRHGTAVAGVVADTAPSADLRLAAVGASTSVEEYREAVDWLLAGGADVVVDSGSYYAQPGDGTGALAGVASNASERAVFVTSVGNHATRYWAGNYTDGELVNFADGYQGNYLNDGQPFSGTVDVSVRWSGWPETDADFDIQLWRVGPNGRYQFAEADGHDGQPFEHLTTRVPRGRYFVSVSATNVSEPTRVEVFASHSLANRTSGGTAAPASAEGVVAVGAVDNGTVRSFSARTNVDLVAPDAVSLAGASVGGGTSFAAPYVAGVAALVTEAAPDLNATEVRDRLYANATDLGAAGVDDASGYGLVSAVGVLATVGTEAASAGNGTAVATDALAAQAEVEARGA